MSDTSPARGSRATARFLLPACSPDGDDPTHLLKDGRLTWEKLTGYLASVLGPTAVEALISRAQSRAGIEIEAASEDHPPDGGGASALPGPERPAIHSLADIHSLLAHLLTLLESLIGLELTLRLVHRALPDTSLSELLHSWRDVPQ